VISTSNLRDSAARFKWRMLFHTKTALGRQLYRLEERPTLDIDLSGKVGMGALICFALRLHALAEDRGMASTIACTSPLYSDGHDVFARYFHRPAPPEGWKPHSALATHWLMQIAAPYRLPLERAHRLFQSHFSPREQLEELVAGRSFDVSVHFRGTDKFVESGHVDAAKMLDALEEFLPRRGEGCQVFLATDDIAFSVAVRDAFPKAQFSDFELGEVAPGTPRHFAELAPEAKALEALANILLLARAPICVRTASYLSATSAIVNPEMRTLTINATPAMHGFPEDEIRMAELPARGLA